MHSSDTEHSDPARPPTGRTDGEGGPDRLLALERAIAERDNELAWTSERLISSD